MSSRPKRAAALKSRIVEVSESDSELSELPIDDDTQYGDEEEEDDNGDSDSEEEFDNFNEGDEFEDESEDEHRSKRRKLGKLSTTFNLSLISFVQSTY